ncbi:hypothetical protein MTO96_040023 [Rhipicephalus appendiculatus]
MASEALRIIDGLPVSEYFTDEAVLSTLAYKPQPGDLFLVGYPKSGSTWTKQIMYSIFTNAKDCSDPFDHLKRFPPLGDVRSRISRLCSQTIGI